MQAQELLENLMERGITVRPDGNLLRVRPKSRLTPELIGELREHKPELLRLVSDRRSWKVLPIATLTRRDLKYQIGFVREHVATLKGRELERYRYWLDLIKSEGYPSEQAMRAAFHRTIKLPRGVNGSSDG